MSRRRTETPLHGFIDLVRPGWRKRAAHRKSPWKFLSGLLVLVVTLPVWYLSFRMMWQVHVFLFPAHAGRLSEFWPEGLRFRVFISSFLLAMPLFFSSLMIGAIIANLLMWCIPPARRSFARDAVNCPEIGFRPVMLSLLRYSWILIVPAFALALIGACTLTSLR